jgi:hypothetical protein
MNDIEYLSYFNMSLEWICNDWTFEAHGIEIYIILYCLLRLIYEAKELYTKYVTEIKLARMKGTNMWHYLPCTSNGNIVIAIPTDHFNCRVNPPEKLQYLPSMRIWMQCRSIPADKNNCHVLMKWRQYLPRTTTCTTSIQTSRTIRCSTLPNNIVKKYHIILKRWSPQSLGEKKKVQIPSSNKPCFRD